MSEDQPRNDDGTFTELDHSKAEGNKDKTIAEWPEDAVTPAAEWVNVDPELLNKGIEQAKDRGVENVRISVLNRTGTDGETGKKYEFGIVLLKEIPSDETITAVAGRRREWEE